MPEREKHLLLPCFGISHQYLRLSEVLRCAGNLYGLSCDAGFGL